MSYLQILLYEYPETFLRKHWMCQIPGFSSPETSVSALPPSSLFSCSFAHHYASFTQVIFRSSDSFPVHQMVPEASFFYCSFVSQLREATTGNWQKMMLLVPLGAQKDDVESLS